MFRQEQRLEGMEFEYELIGAIDQSTSSSRFIIYQLNSRKIIASHQIELQQIFPYPGWVEINPEEIITTTIECIDECCKAVRKKALHNAICWLDDRTAKLVDLFIEKTTNKSNNAFKEITGLPIYSYFSALKIRWLLDNVDKVKDALERGTLMFGTVDTWLIYKLTGRHITDVTNASRTLLMSIKTLKWNKELCDFFGIPMSILPEIHSSAEIYATINSGPLEGVPISGCLGDQQAAMFGEFCFNPGEIKCTYGTGTFMLANIGNNAIIGGNGLLTTVAYQLGPEENVCYAMEGSGSIGGNAIRFLRDNFKFIKDLSEVEKAASLVTGTDGVVFVPCFTGLYTPYWDSSARGILCGLAQTTVGAHIVRAVLEAVCFQTEEMIDALRNDMPNNQEIKALKVDGGLTANSLFLQILSDIIGIDVIKAANIEASSWGAAMIAAIGAKIISFEEFEKCKEETGTIKTPNLSVDQRELMIRRWKKQLVVHVDGLTMNKIGIREESIFI
ncbi:Glycerol kinase [Dirofilaria immitis]|nr:Glycerol kinase [Dirofilaria immitis]